jgi:hypothetical protein
MKWATTEIPSLDQIGKTYQPLIKGPVSDVKKEIQAISNELNAYVEKLAPVKDPGDLYKEGFGEWLIVQSDQLPPGLTDTDKLNYKVFIGGFLYYFEKHVSSIKGDDRTVFIDWGKINKNAGLTIYLKPLYRPCYNRKGDKIEIIYHDDKSQNCGSNININITRSPLAPPPDIQTDPPPPPQPPPPPRHLS